MNNIKTKKVICICLRIIIVLLSICLSFNKIEASSSGLQDKFVSTAINDYNKGTKYPSNTCLKWVNDMYDKAFDVKIKRKYASAADASKSLSTRKALTSAQKNGDPNGIPKGAVIFWKGGKNLPYGHVGIYDGNGYVYHNYSGTLTKYKYKKYIDKGYSLYGVNWAWIGDNNLQGPPKTTISSLLVKGKSLTIKWNKQTTRTTGYTVQYSTDPTFSSKKSFSVSQNTIICKTVSELKNNSLYYVRIRCKRKFGNTTVYSGWSSAKSAVIGKVTTTTKTTNTTTKKSTTKATTATTKGSTTTTKVTVNKVTNIKAYQNNQSTIVEWSAVSGANGYEVQKYDDNSKKWTTVTTLGTNNFTDKNIVPGNTYLYRVRAYKLVNNTKYYSEYNQSNSVLIVSDIPKITNNSNKADGSTMWLNWNALTASGYEIQVSENNSFDKFSSYTINNGKATSWYNASKQYKKDVIYYIKIRSYVTKDNINYYSEWSSTHMEMYSDKKRIVPDVVGLSFEEANEIIKNNDLTIRTTKIKAIDKTLNGKIKRTSPVAGSIVNKNSLIDIYVYTY